MTTNKPHNNQITRFYFDYHVYKSFFVYLLLGAKLVGFVGTTGVIIRALWVHFFG